MKKYFIFTLTVLLSVSLSLSAQDTNRKQRGKTGQREQRAMKFTAKDRAEMMDKQLNLTDAQLSQLQILFESHDAERAEQFKEMKAKREQGIMGDREKHREEMKALRTQRMNAHDAQVESIIGKAKMDEWKKIRQDRRDNTRGKMRNKKSPNNQI